jgi:hypothetical protein
MKKRFGIYLMISGYLVWLLGLLVLLLIPHFIFGFVHNIYGVWWAVIAAVFFPITMAIVPVYAIIVQHSLQPAVAIFVYLAAGFMLIRLGNTKKAVAKKIMDGTCGCNGQ